MKYRLAKPKNKSLWGFLVLCIIISYIAFLLKYLWENFLYGVEDAFCETRKEVRDIFFRPVYEKQED